MYAKPNVNDQPLTPALSPYEGERVTISLVLGRAYGLVFRSCDIVVSDRPANASALPEKRALGILRIKV
jgi:hypothetical protein